MDYPGSQGNQGAQGKFGLVPEHFEREDVYLMDCKVSQSSPVWLSPAR